MMAWQCLREGVTAFTRKFGILMGAWLVIFAVRRLLLLLIPDAYALVRMILQVVILSPLYAGQYLVALKAVRDEPVRFGEFFDGFARLGVLVGASILVSVAVFAGLILFIVPGIVWALGFAFSPILLVDRSRPKGPVGGVVDALLESMRLARGHRWTLFWISFLLALPSFLYTGIVYVSFYYPDVIAIPAWAIELFALFGGFLFIGPVYATSLMVVYDRAVGRMGEETAATA